MLVGLLMGHLGYIICLIYISVSLAFFLVGLKFNFINNMLKFISFYIINFFDLDENIEVTNINRTSNYTT